MEVQQRPDVGRRTVDLKCIWLSGSAVGVNAVIGKGPPQLGKWDKQLRCSERGRGVHFIAEVEFFPPWGCRSLPACLPFRGVLMICNICVNIFGGLWAGGGVGGGGGLLFSLWRGGEGLQLSVWWTWVQVIQNPAPYKKKEGKKLLNLSNCLKKIFSRMSLEAVLGGLFIVDGLQSQWGICFYSSLESEMPFIVI